VTGKVETEVGWTADKLASMATIEAEYTNKDGETTSFTGVPLNDLLGTAVAAGDAAGTVMPGFSSKAQVKGVVEIQVK